MAAAFFATLSQAANTTSDKPIIFDNVVINYGDGFDRDTGVFKAPFQGVYQFNYSANRENDTAGTYFNINMMKDDIRIVQAKIDSGRDGHLKGKQQVSQSAILELNAGDKVWLIQNDNNNSLMGENMCSFSGNFLFATFSKKL